MRQPFTRKALLITGLVIVCLAAAAYVAFWFLTNSEEAYRLVQEKAVPALEEALEAEISIGGAGGTLTGGLVWDKVVLRWPEVTVRVDHAEFGVDLLALRNRVVRLTGVTAQRPYASLTLDRAEEIRQRIKKKQPQRSRSKPTGRPWTIILDGLNITDGKLDGLDGIIAGLKLGPLTKTKGRGRLEFTRDQETRRPLWRVKADVDCRAAIEGADTAAKLKAELNQTHIDLERLLVQFGPDQRSKLTAKGRFDENPDRADLKLTGRLYPADLPGGWGLPALPGLSDLDGRFKIDLTKTDLDADLTWDRAKAKAIGTVAWADGKMDLRGRVADFDPARLKPIIRAELPAGLVSGSYRITGVPGTDLSIKAELSPSRLNDLIKIDSGRVDLKLVGPGVSGTVAFDRAEADRARADSITVTGYYRPDQAEAKTTFTNLKAYDSRADRGGFNFSWRPDRLAVSDLVLEEPDGRLTGNLTGRIKDGYLVGGSTAVNMDRFRPPTALILELCGLSLPLTDLAKLRLTGPLALDWPGPMMSLKSTGLNLDSPWGKISGRGSAAWDQSGYLSDYLLDLDLTKFKTPRWLWPFLPQEVRQALIDGRVKLRNTASGASLESPGLDVQVPWGDLALAGTVNLDRQARPTDIGLTVQLNHVTVPENLKNKLPVGLAQATISGPVRIQGKADSYRLTSPGLAASGPWGGLQAQGRADLDGTGQLTGLEVGAKLDRATAPAGLIPDPPPGLDSVFLTGPVKASLTGSNVQVVWTDLAIQSPWGGAASTGRADLDKSGKLIRLTARSNLAKAVWPDWLPITPPQGVDQVVVNGGLGLDYTPAGLTLSADSLKADTPWGQASADGQVALDPAGAPRKIDLAVALTKATKPDWLTGFPELDRTSLDGPLKIHWSPPTTELSAQDLHIAAPWGGAALTGSVKLDGDQKPTFIDLTADLKNVVKPAWLDRGLPPQIDRLSLNGTASAAWDGQSWRLGGQDLVVASPWGRIKLTGRSELNRALQPEALSVQAEFKDFSEPDWLKLNLPPQVKQLVLNGAASADLTDKSIRFTGRDLNIASPWGTVLANGTADLTRQGVVQSLDARLALTEATKPDWLTLKLPGLVKGLVVDGPARVRRTGSDWSVHSTGLDCRLPWGRLTAAGGASLDNAGRVRDLDAGVAFNNLTPPVALLTELIPQMPAQLAQTKLSGGLKATGNLTALTIGLDGLTVDSPWGRAKGTGSIGLNSLGSTSGGRPARRDLTADLNIDLTKATLPGWLKISPPPELAGARYDGQIKVAGRTGDWSLASPGLTASFKWGRVKAAGRTGLKAIGRTWRPRGLKADLTLTKATPPPRLAALLPERLRGVQLSGRVKATSPDKAISRDKGNSRNKATDSAWGPINFQTDLTGLLTEAVPLDKFTAKGVASNRELRLTGLNLVAAGATVSGSGRVWPTAELSYRLESAALSGSLTDLLDLPQPLSASQVKISGRLTGPWSKPALSASVQTGPLAWSDRRADGLKFEVKADDCLPGARQDLTGRAKLELTGFKPSLLPRQSDLRLELTADQGRFTGRISSGNKNYRGAAEFDWSGSRLTLPRLNLFFAKPEPNKWRNTAPIVIDLNGGQSSRIQLALISQTGEKVTLDLTGGLEEASGRGRIVDLNIQPWATALGLPGQTSGKLSADFELSGRTDSPTAKLSGLLMHPQAAGQSFDRVTISGAYNLGRLQAEAMIIADKRTVGKLTVDGPARMSFRPWRLAMDPDRIKARLAVEDFPLASAAPLFSQLDRLEGTLNAKVDLGRRWTGQIDVDDLLIQPAGIGQAFRRGKLALRLDDRRLNLTTARLNMGGGEALLKGWIDLKPGVPLNLSAEVFEASVNLGRYGRTMVDGRLTINGDLVSPRVQGRLSLPAMQIELPEYTTPESKEIIMVDDDQTGAPKGRPAGPGWSKASLDVDLKVGPAAWVHGEGLRAQLEGDLNILKKPGQELGLTGQINVTKGYFARFGRRFVLQKGGLIFKGQVPPQPAIDLTAVYRISNIDIFLYLTGSADKPHLTFTSEPNLTQEEVLAYLLYGRSAEGLTHGQAAELGESAAIALGGPAASLMSGILDESLVPDTLNVANDPEWGMSVEAGKQIFPDLYLSYEHFTEQDKPNEFHLEYQLNKNLSLRSSLGDERTQGVDLFMRFDFD